MRLDGDGEVESLQKAITGRSIGEHHAKLTFMFRAEREAEVGLLWGSGKEEAKCVRGMGRETGSV